MNWLRRLQQWWRELCDACGEPWPEWDSEFPEPEPDPEIPDGMSCPETRPGEKLLETLPGRLD